MLTTASRADSAKEILAGGNTLTTAVAKCCGFLISLTRTTVSPEKYEVTKPVAFTRAISLSSVLQEKKPVPPTAYN